MIRLATINDIENIWDLRLKTTELLKSRGIDQWQYKDPTKETFLKDIENEEFFVYVENQEIIGMLAIKHGVEPTYLNIYNGSWSYDLPYLTIHRLAVKKSHLGKGLSHKLLKFSEEYALSNQINYIRIDTHQMNKSAIRLFESNHYKLCGVIYLTQKEGDKKRLAFDKKLEEKL